MNSGEIPADRAVGSGDDDAGRMNVLVARRLVAITEADRLGDRPHGGFRPGQEMPAVVRCLRCVTREIFNLRRGGVGRRVARVDADRENRVIPPAGRIGEIAKKHAANRPAPQVIEHQNDRLAGEEMAERDASAGFIDQLRGKRQSRAGPWFEREIAICLAAGQSGRGECREGA